MATLEELETRLKLVEEEMAVLRRKLLYVPAQDTPIERAIRAREEAFASQPAISAIIAEVFAKMGVTGEPVGAEKLQEMMRACGVNPEDNAFSREIIAARDE